MAEQIYKVQDPEGNVREIAGPPGASDEDIIAQAKNLLVAKGARGLFTGGPMGMAFGVNQAVSEMVPKFAYKAGQAATDLTGSPEAGWAANVATQAIPVFAGGAIAGKAAPAMEKTAKWLMTKAVKPSVVEPQFKSAAAIDTLLKEGINPTKGGIAKLREMTAALDREISQTIASSTANVDKFQVGTRLRDTLDKFRAQVNPNSDIDTIRRAWTEFRTHPDLAGKRDMPVQLAHELKRGTYARLNEKAYGEVGTASKEAQKALARGLREEVGVAVPETVAPMARQAELMNAANVSQRTALTQANANPTGLSPVASSPYGFLGFMADRSSAFKAALARALYSGKKAIPENTARIAAMLGVTPNATEE